MEVNTENNSYSNELDVVNVRLVKEPALLSDVPISSNEVAVDVIRNLLKEFDREAFCMLNVNTKLEPINFNIVSIGTLNSTVVSPRDAFKSSILSNGGSFICLHCHPSGSVKPSMEDALITKKLKEAGEILDIKMLDHIIVGGGNGKTYSFAEHGYLKAPDIVAHFELQKELERWER